jgi:hypothetical protein
VKLMPLTFDELERKARELAGQTAHLHTTVPGCLLTGGDARPAIVLEDSASGVAYAFFGDRPIEQRARPLAVLLHGADSVPSDDEVLAPACAEVQRMAERFEAGRGHFHILNPACLANPHPGRWTILFEDEALGTLERTTDERPLDDIRYVERLIYARG